MTNSRRKRKQKRNGRICISLIVVLFLTIMSVQIVKLYQKDQGDRERINALTDAYEDETERQNHWIITKNIPGVRNILKTRQRASWD